MRPWARATGAAWLAAALALALAGGLFLPRERAGAVELARVRALLVDASASVARGSEWLPWARATLRAEAQAAAARAEELVVVSFADGVRTGAPLAPPERFLRALAGADGPPFDPGEGLARGATRLAGALEAAADALLDPRRPPGELVLLAPPAYTGASPAAALARLAEGGVTTRVRPPPRAARADLGLVALELAPRVETGAPLTVRVRGVFRAGAEPVAAAELVLEVAHGAETRVVRRGFAPPPADGEFELLIEAGPAGAGRNALSARVGLADGPDLLPENDRARALTYAEGGRVVAVVSTPELRPAAEAWLAPSGRSALAGLEFVFVEPAELARELPGCSLLVTFDLAPSSLPAPLVGPFVRSGGGWLAVSGWHFLDGWVPGDAEGELERLLPCEPAQESAPPRDVVLLVDGSGSMEGAAFDSVRAASLELVAAALPTDRVSLRFFTVRLEREHLLKERAATRAADAEAARRAAQQLLALRVPDGATFLVSSVRELATELGAHETLVLLLSDGWERDALADPEGEARAAAAELARAGGRLAVIAVGTPNRALLAALAGGEERVRSGATLEDLRAVFRRELSGARVAEGVLALRWAARAPGSLADEVASAAADEPALVPLERCVRNRLRPGAEASWELEAGEPALALMRAGLGRTALFGSRPGAGWANGYARAGLGQPAEFEGLLRWLARAPEPGRAPRARLEDGLLVLHGLGPEAPPELAARLVDLAADGASTTVVLLASGRLPGEVLRTRAAPQPSGAWRDPVLVLGADGGLGPELAVPVERVLSDELAWRERPVPVEWLSAANVPRATPDPRTTRAHPAAPWVLALGLALLFGAALASTRGSHS